MGQIFIERNTKETQIKVTLDLGKKDAPRISTGVPFFDHMLTAMAFHGGFYLEVEAQGDVEVDPHHLVEDVGLVLGDGFHRAFEAHKAIKRYGTATIPMDEALSEVVIDVCNRPTLVYQARLPQPLAGTFDLSLLREFFIALANKAQVSLHLICRYGENSHHMVEALFKALGKALAQAYTPQGDGQREASTKGVL